MSNTKTISPPVFNQADEASPNINRIVFAALLPAMIMSVIFFGLGSLKVLASAVLSCLLFEYLIRKYLLKIPATIPNGSAVITGVLLAFNLPAALPVGLIVAGSLVAIGISANSSGKFWRMPFNAVLVSRLLLRIFFPVQMTTWPAVVTKTDSLTGLTPLEILNEGLKNGKTIGQITSGTEFSPYFDLFWGNVNGPLGEISVIALLMGGLYLVSKKIITWHMPAALLGSVFLFQGALWVLAPGQFMDPLFHLITGGVMLMAFFMATDPATSPLTPGGKLLAGIGMGLIIITIRNFGAYPGEIFVALLIVNGITPLINAKTKTPRFAEN